jgi:hypothetical protein
VGRPPMFDFLVASTKVWDVTPERRLPSLRRLPIRSGDD